MHRVRITLANYRGFSDENPGICSSWSVGQLNRL